MSVFVIYKMVNSQFSVRNVSIHDDSNFSYVLKIIMLLSFSLILQKYSRRSMVKTDKRKTYKSTTSYLCI